MDENAIPVSENTVIILRTSADLQLSGGDQAEVRFYGSQERVQFQQENGVLRIGNHSGLDLMVPRTANVRVEKVGGSAFMQDLGLLEIQKVGGDLALQRIEQVEIGKVGGSLTVRQVTGPFRVHRIGGDLTARDLGGQVSIEMVGGNADVQAAGGEELVLRAGGDLNLRFTEMVGQYMALRAGGDVALYIPGQVNARFEVVNDSEELRLRFNRQDSPMDELIEQRRYEFVLGSGEGRIEIRSGGDCLISDEEKEFSSLEGEFERLATSWENARENRARYGWPGHFDPSRSAAWADMIGKRAQEAARRAEQKAQAAVRRMEEQSRRMAEKESRRAWQYSTHAAPPPPPPPQPTSQVTEQERLMVLQMLQDNKITVEQAESLLRALEGRYSDQE